MSLKFARTFLRFWVHDKTRPKKKKIVDMEESIDQLLKKTREEILASISKFEKIAPIECLPCVPKFNDESRVYLVRSKNGIAFRRSARYDDRDRERIGPLSGQMLVGIKEEMDVKSNVVMLLCEDFHGNQGWICKTLRNTDRNLLTELKRRRYRVVASRGVAWRQRCEYESRVTCTPGPPCNTQLLALCERTDRRSGVRMVYVVVLELCSSAKRENLNCRTTKNFSYYITHSYHILHDSEHSLISHTIKTNTRTLRSNTGTLVTPDIKDGFL